MDFSLQTIEALIAPIAPILIGTIIFLIVIIIIFFGNDSWLGVQP